MSDHNRKRELKNKMTYDFICFSELLYEYAEEENALTIKKIKRRIRYHKLGEYKKERVDYIRALKNALCAELSNPYRSAYYKKPPSGIAGLNDFDEAGLKKKYKKMFSRIADEDLYTIIAFAIYWYYLR